MSELFRIKICGVTSAKDAQFAALAGAEAIGLNFFSESPRFLDEPTAQAICKVLPAKVARVGVFVNASHEEIAQRSEQCGLDYIQLHGDEPPEFLAELGPQKVIRAFRCRVDDFGAVADYWEQCSPQKPDMVLLDAYCPEEYGGTGETLDWAQLASHLEIFAATPVMLAGGLTPFNVEEAIQAVRPAAVDVASGVESEQGQKDLLLVRAFCNAARKAFKQLEGQA